MKSFMEGLSREEGLLFREKASSLTMGYLEARGLMDEGSAEFVEKSMDWYLGNRSLEHAMREYGHLQSDNTDWESRNQLAGYAERVGVTLRPGEMKSLVEDFVKVDFKEAEEDFTEQLSRSRGMSR